MQGIKGLDLIWFWVSDWRRAKDFYARLLGFKLVFVDDEQGWAEFEVVPDQVKLALHHWRNSEPLPRGGGGCPVLIVEDLKVTMSELEKAGIQFTAPPTEVKGVKKIVTLVDPDGNPLQLTQLW